MGKGVERRGWFLGRGIEEVMVGFVFKVDIIVLWGFSWLALFCLR